MKPHPTVLCIHYKPLLFFLFVSFFSSLSFSSYLSLPHSASFSSSSSYVTWPAQYLYDSNCIITQFVFFGKESEIWYYQLSALFPDQAFCFHVSPSLSFCLLMRACLSRQLSNKSTWVLWDTQVVHFYWAAITFCHSKPSKSCNFADFPHFQN